LVEGVIHTCEDEDVGTASSPSDDSASAKSSQSKLGKATLNGEDKKHDAWNKIRFVPKDLIVAQFEGCWKKTFRWRRMEKGLPVGEWETLLDMAALGVFPKSVRPIEQQGTFESRKLWQGVSENLLKKDYSEATRVKVGIEQAQRDRAAERKRTGQEFVPVYFEADMSSGWSELTEAGRQVVEEELALP
jgi:hypothetical protein